MSINDLLNDDSFLPIMAIVIIVVLVIAIPIGISASKKTNNTIYGDDDYNKSRETKNATLVSKEKSPHPLNQSVMVNMAIFELNSGARLKFAIKDPNTYGVMVIGDKGELTYQGSKFIDFRRSN